MKRLFIVIIFATVLVLSTIGQAFAEQSQDIWWPVGGTPGSASAKYFQKVDGVLYAGTDDGGVWALNGATWSQIGSFSDRVGGFATVDGTLFVGIDGSGVRALSGHTWYQVGSLSGDAARVASMTTVNGAVYAGTYGSGVWTLNGDMWSQVGSPSGYAANVYSLATVNNKLYVGTYSGVWTLNGDTWSQVGNFSHRVHSLVNVNGRLFAGTYDYGVWNLKDNTWVEVGSLSSKHGQIHSLATVDSTLYGAGSNGVWTLEGNKWTQIGNLSGAAGLANIDDILYAGTYRNGVWALNGDKWSHVPVGSLSGSIEGLANVNGVLYAGTGDDRVWAIGGIKWSQAGSLSDSIESLANVNGALYAGTYGGVWTLNGNTWSPVGSLSGYAANVKSLATVNDAVYAGTYGGVWALNGDTWSQVGNLSGAEARVTSLTTVRDAVYAGTYGGGVLTLNGDTWSPVGSLSRYAANVFSLATVNSAVYAGTDGSGVWALNGDKWSPVGSLLGDAANVKSLATVNDALYAGTKDGVYILNGDAWFQVGSLLGDAANVKSLITAYGTVLAGTNNGVWGIPLKATLVTADDVNNVIVGADDTMEYSTDNGNTYTAYNPSNPPVFSGDVTVMVRVAADTNTGVPAGIVTTLTFTANPSAPNVGVTLNKSNITLTAGGYDRLTATITPSNVTNQTVTWSSDNQDVATVNQSGLVIAAAVGTANITVTTAEGNKTANCTVTVSAAPSSNTTVRDSSPNVSLSSEPLNVNVPDTVNNATLKTTPIVSGTAILPRVIVQSNTSQGDVTIDVSAGTQVTGLSNWDGTINLPQVVNNASVTLSGYTTTVDAAVEIGLDDTALTFSQPVRILLADQGGKNAGWIRNGVFTPITYQMTSDSADDLNGNADGYITIGNDLAIWTTHFTTFIAYTKSPISSGGGGGGGSDSGVHVTTTPVLTTGTITDNSVVLSLATTADVKSFNIYKNGSSTPVNNEPITATDNQAEYTVTGLTPNTSYSFTALAIDTSGNTSDTSNAITITTQDIDQTAPDKVTFADVPATFWAYKDIEYMAGKGYVHGISNNVFDPNKTITRAEFTAMLVNVLDLEGKGKVQFDDVKPEAWYYTSVAKAFKAGLVHGVTTSHFSPNDPVTRVQMVALVANAFKYKGVKINLVNQSTILDKFSDSESIPKWAKSSAAAVVQKGIIAGQPTAGTQNGFAPLAKTTRAEATVILKRMLNNL